MYKIKEDKLNSIHKAAAELFKSYGFTKVTIDEICKLAGVSKTTFYKAFEDKETIAHFVISKASKKIKEDSTFIKETEYATREKIIRLFDLHDQFVKIVGYEFISQLMSNDSRAHDVLNKTFQTFNSNLRTVIQEGRKSAQVNPKLKIDFIFFILNQMHNLEANQELKALIPDSNQRGKQLMSVFFDGIFTNN